MENILLIEPDLALRGQLTFVLQHSGFQVAGVTGGDEALAKMDTGSPDLIVMAERSHIVNGDELCIRIRQICQAPIIILGQDREEAAGVNFLEMGADVYLTSPLDIRELLAYVHSLLRRYKESLKEYERR